WPSPGITMATNQSITGSINNRDQAYPFLQWAGSPTVALAFPKLQTGTSTSYFTGFASGANIWQIYANDSTSTNYTDGLQSTIRSTGGAGAGAIRPVNAVAQAGAGSDLSEAYGVQGWVDMTNAKGRVRDNVYGVIGYLDINTGFTPPINYVQGVLGVLDSDISLAGAAISGAVTADVKWGLITPNVDGAFVAFRDGGGAGGTQGAAFKLKRIATNSINEFTYGLDLYGGAAAGGTGLDNSIRGQNQSIFDNEIALKWRSDSELEVSGPALAALDWSARAGSVQGVGSRLSADFATVTSLKGADFRSTSLGGNNPAGAYVVGAQLIATMGAGTVAKEEMYGVNAISNQVAGNTTNSYGSAGVLNIGAGTNVIQYAIGALGLYDDQQGVNVGTNFTTALMGAIADRNTAGPDAAVTALLQGDGVRQPAQSPNAAFWVVDRSTVVGTGFNYGLDMYYANGGVRTIFNVADIRMASTVTISSGNGVPAGALCGGVLPLGSIYLNLGGGGATSLYVCEVGGAWVGK
ncbi:MAG: hypothetical protein MUO70_05195, partial [Euryarchaeota archaeon]|nr:hypothetical protein [Euryarchaeota archaeon]